MNAEEVMLEGLRAALMEATGNLYRVFTSVDYQEDREHKFLKGVMKHRMDYERMAAIVKSGSTR